MALNKTIQPGTLVTVVSTKGKTAGIVMSPAQHNGLDIWESPGQIKVAVAIVGDTMSIVKGPRKVNGINLCRVKYNSIEGEMYWTELRSNAKS